MQLRGELRRPPLMLTRHWRVRLLPAPRFQRAARDLSLLLRTLRGMGPLPQMHRSQVCGQTGRFVAFSLQRRLHLHIPMLRQLLPCLLCPCGTMPTTQLQPLRPVLPWGHL